MNQLRISWHDSAWLPHLNQSNVMDYFCQKTNPFYEKTCNNEIARMQRISTDQMLQMNGVEYILLHVQDPILYVIRKQIRSSATTVKPIADYYILAGVIYQAPDINSIIQSRVLNATKYLKKALDDCSSNEVTSATSLVEKPEDVTKFQLKVHRLIETMKNTANNIR